MLFLWQYGSGLEKTVFNGRAADFIYMLILGGIVVFIAGVLLAIPFIGMGLIMMLIYYWSKKTPNVTITFLFGIQFPSQYLPWAMCGMTLLLGGFPIIELIGIVAGHSYLFADEIFPNIYHYRIIQTPDWLYNILPPQLNRYTATAAAAARAPANPPANRASPFVNGHNWGRGYTLNQ